MEFAERWKGGMLESCWLSSAFVFQHLDIISGLVRTKNKRYFQLRPLINNYDADPFIFQMQQRNSK